MTWAKNDEFMGWKVVSGPKKFDKWETFIWKKEGETGYFVTVHDSTNKGQLTNVKFFSENGKGVAPIAITVNDFQAAFLMVKNDATRLGVEVDIYLDLTNENNNLLLWNKVFKDAWVIKPNTPVLWSDSGLIFILGMHLEAYFERME